MVEQAEIHRLVYSTNRENRKKAGELLMNAFPDLLDRSQAWEDLHRLTLDKDSDVRWRAADALGSVFFEVPDKMQAWKDLHRLAQDQDRFVRWSAADALGSVFFEMPDKMQAWKDLHGLSSGQNRNARVSSADALKLAFSYVPDREQAWEDLHRLAQDQDKNVRASAAFALGSVFSNVSDKEQAWEDLHRLTLDKDRDVRWSAAFALGSVFSHVPDRERAWEDLHRLTLDKNRNVRASAAFAFGSVFSHMPDRERAWEDLHRLTLDLDRYVRWSAAFAFGSAFPHVPDKEKAWKDLCRLAIDNDSFVRMYAYHSLGRASILKATDAENKECLLSELETAIGYFEKSSQEDPYSPAKFCLAFYRSYAAITLLNAKEDEVKRYLAEAKKAVGGSKSRAYLIEAVENLARALEESHKLNSRKSIEEITNELNTYRWYCEEAASHMHAAEERAPGVVRLMRKCNPILENSIEAIITEIQEKAKQIHQITQGTGTEYEAFGAEISHEARSISVDNLLGPTQRSIFNIADKVKELCKYLPQERRALVCKAAEEVQSSNDLPEKIEKLEQALEYILAYIRAPFETYEGGLVDIVILTILPQEYAAICSRLSNLRPPSQDTPVQNRYAWKLGEVTCKRSKKAYTLAIGMIGRAGTIQSALATYESILLWKPLYLILVGIAGGLTNVNKGDVVIASIIHGYEYGKIDDGFYPRDDWTYCTDLSLMTSAIAFNALYPEWADCIEETMQSLKYKPEVSCGEFASGDKVVDNPADPFFNQVLKRWPKIVAVEMEGAGAANAIQHVKGLRVSYSHTVEFIMIRGISDLPRSSTVDEVRGNKERDNWKSYASATAAAFTLGWIADGLPILPAGRSLASN
jgi:HEAT repeat protein/nucleoside phosphorylase